MVTRPGLSGSVRHEGSYGESGIFAGSGRALADNSYLLNGGGESSQGFDGFGSASIGADGAQGLMFGGRCPASLPPAAGGYCGGAGVAFTNLEIIVNDPSDPRWSRRWTWTPRAEPT